MALTQLTKVDGGGISTTSDYRVGVITATKFVGPIEGSITATDATFSGNVSIAGTLTYEDVTNIDSVGIITAQSDIHVGAGVSAVGVGTFGSLDISGDIDVDGHTNLDNVNISGITTGGGFKTAGTSSDGGATNAFTAGRINIYDNGSHNIFRIGASSPFAPTVWQTSAITFSTSGFHIRNVPATRDYINTDNTTGIVKLGYGGANNYGYKLETSEKGIKVGTGVTIETNGQATFVGVSTFNDDVNVIQGKKINFGNVNGTQGHIYFDGSTTRLQTNHGLNIGSPVCVFKSANLAETMVEAIHNGAVKLWYDQSNHSTPKIQTTATGVTIDGTAVAGALDISGNIDVDGHTNLDNVSIAGVSTFSGNLDANGVVYVRQNASPTIYLTSNSTTGSGRLFFGDPDSDLVGRLSYVHNGDYFTFYAGYGERFRIAGNGDITVTSIDNFETGPTLKLFHNSASPAANDVVSRISMFGDDAAGNETEYGRIETVIDDPADGQETGHINLSTRGLGSFANVFRIKRRSTGSAPSYTADDADGIILDVYNTGNPYPRYMNFIAKSAGNTDSNIAFWTEAVGGSPSEKLRITSGGFIGINDSAPKTGLTIGKLGDYSANDGNTYYMPVGKWSSVWNAANAIVDNTDYWVGFLGGYHKSGNSVNIALSPNRGNVSAQQGMYISGEGTGISSADFAVGKILGGSATGQGTSGNVRATKSELFRITNTGKVGINTASPRAVLDIEGHAENATLFLHSNDANANLAFSDNTGGARILNYGGDLAFRTGANAHAFGTGDSEKLRIEDNGSVGIGTDDASWGLSGNGGLVVGSGTGSQAITIFCAGNADLSFGDAKSGTARYAGLIRYSHGDDSMRFRTATSERLLINSSGNVQIGNENNPGNALRYLDVYNTNTGSSAGSILRLLTTKSDGSSTVGLDIVKYKAGGAYIINNENVGADTGFIAFNTGSSGVAPATHLRVAGNGEVVVSPRNGGASNNRTSIHFNNAAHTPFIAFKSNNVTEAAYIKAGESSGGCDLEFQTKNTSGTLLSRLTLKNGGEIFTHQLAGGQKGYPLIMGTGTVANNTNMSGSINMHDINGVHTSGGNNYHIGGWVFLGNDQAAAPYPVRRFKIFAPSAFSNGTIVYQVWHDGDSNYYYGGLWEIRINLWTDGDIEGVSLRCVNGYRDDLRLFAYNDSNGIMVQPSSIWGRMFIRRFGYDDGGRNPGSSYCAVANNGALAIYNSQGTDDGAIPTSGSPAELYSFDGTGGSNGASHTGLYNREGSSYARG